MYCTQNKVERIINFLYNHEFTQRLQHFKKNLVKDLSSWLTKTYFFDDPRRSNPKRRVDLNTILLDCLIVDYARSEATIDYIKLSEYRISAIKIKTLKIIPLEKIDLNYMISDLYAINYSMAFENNLTFWLKQCQIKSSDNLQGLYVTYGSIYLGSGLERYSDLELAKLLIGEVYRVYNGHIFKNTLMNSHEEDALLCVYACTGLLSKSEEEVVRFSELQIKGRAKLYRAKHKKPIYLGNATFERNHINRLLIFKEGVMFREQGNQFTTRRINTVSFAEKALLPYICLKATKKHIHLEIDPLIGINVERYKKEYVSYLDL